MGSEKWFSFSEDSGFQRHTSAEDARACAQRALDYDESEAGCDGWPEGTDRICWGEVREAAVGTVTHRHGPDCRPDSSDDEDDDTCTEGYSMLFDSICEFNMTPTDPPSEIDALRARAEAAERELAQARADARVLACQWRAVDDTEDLQFFGACWREAHPRRSERDLGRDPTMADLVAALRRALGGAA